VKCSLCNAYAKTLDGHFCRQTHSCQPASHIVRDHLQGECSSKTQPHLMHNYVSMTTIPCCVPHSNHLGVCASRCNSHRERKLGLELGVPQLPQYILGDMVQTMLHIPGRLVLRKLQKVCFLTALLVGGRGILCSLQKIFY
jgi:hypothetical protein